ncbi:hypothetical protein Lser_V15G13264 [Lactuca serriola]
MVPFAHHKKNGVAEQQNRTLQDAARTMLCDSKLPVFFWSEPINTTYYVQNFVLINKAQMKTPYEILYGHKPSVSHFHIFGSPCTLLHLESNPKFNAKADDCYFMGYAARTAYMVYNKRTKQIVESFDVCWSEENKTDARVGPYWLFTYTSLFKSFNVFSDNLSCSCSSSKTMIEDEDEEVVYSPPMVSSMTPIVDTSIPSNLSDSPCHQTNPDADATPLNPDERELMSRDTSVATQTFMELLFPEPIANKFVASPSHDSSASKVVHIADDGFVNIHNLPIMLNDIN